MSFSDSNWCQNIVINSFYFGFCHASAISMDGSQRGLTSAPECGLGDQSAGSLDDLQASQADKALAAECVCTPAIHRSNVVIMCATCNRKCPIACLLHELKQSDKGQIKPNVSYSCLKNFIDFHKLQYLCVPCRLSRGNASVGNTNGGIPSAVQCSTDRSSEQLALDVDNLCTKVTEISNQISVLQSTLASFVSSTNNNSVADYLPSEPTLISAPKQSYATAASKDLTATVKTAVAESLKQQRVVDRSSASLVIYGMAENQHDMTEVRDLFKNIGCEYICCQTVSYR